MSLTNARSYFLLVHTRQHYPMGFIFALDAESLSFHFLSFSFLDSAVNN